MSPAAPANLKVRDLSVADEPRPGADETPDDRLAGKDVRELQGLIERAFRALDEAAAPVPAVVSPAAVETEKPVAGHAAGSAVQAGTTFGRRAIKSLIALGSALVIGVLPLEKLLTSASTEAFVNAPIVTLTAPLAGRVGADMLPVGSVVSRDETIATLVAGPDNVLPIASPTVGKVWEVLTSPGDRVAAGQSLLRVVGCSAASVTAAVSGTVYDQLRPGTPARFNFYGENTFYYGTVANLFGHAAPTGDFAIPPVSLASDAFRVVVALPDLGAVPSCAVGRRGEVVFNRAAG